MTGSRLLYGLESIYFVLSHIIFILSYFSSVVGGLASVPVIAVPTSIGYGASFSGVSALLTMLNSCSPGVGVVNIDNGFGAAALAYKML